MDKFKASIVKYICPICGEVAEEGIIMNSLLSEKAASEVEKLHGKAAPMLQAAEIRLHRKHPIRFVR